MNWNLVEVVKKYEKESKAAQLLNEYGGKLENQKKQQILNWIWWYEVSVAVLRKCGREEEALVKIGEYFVYV